MGQAGNQLLYGAEEHDSDTLNSLVPALYEWTHFRPGACHAHGCFYTKKCPTPLFIREIQIKTK